MGTFKNSRKITLFMISKADKKINKKLAILIITKDDPKKLKRVLSSIEKNNFLSNSEILLIDNSSKKEYNVKNDNLLLSLKKNEVIYIDKFQWIKIRNILANKLKDKRLKDLLKDINLGTKKGDIHHARNAAAIICSLLYYDSDLIICFDDDMVIPKDFSFKDNLSYPMGIPLKGSPDLSRLEWMRLYNKLRYLYFPKSNNKDYISNLANRFSKNSIKRIIESYTNILESKKKSEELLNFPKREELNAGSFISPMKEIATQFYPSWFDNDWFWFAKHRKDNNYPLKFINSSIIHLSSKKNVFNKEFLGFEEIGKIITNLLKDKSLRYIPREKEIKKEIERRREIIKNEMDLIRDISSKTKNKKEEKARLRVLSHLKFLYKFLCSIKTSLIKGQIHSYEKENKHWRLLIKDIKKYGTLKLELFGLLNKKEFLIFSPHCDDVAFSLGGSIINNFLKNIIVCTIYTKTNYYLNKSEKIKNVTKTRLNEEIKVFRNLGISYTFLNFNDSEGREYFSENEYISPSNNPKKDSSFIRVKNKIYQIVNKKKDKILLFPLGIGYHVDHRILFEIGKELSKKGHFVLFYEDVGYKMTEKNDLIQTYVRENFPQLASRTFFFNNVEDKIKLCEEYKTQISKEIINNINKIARKREGERVWSTIETFRTLKL